MGKKKIHPDGCCEKYKKKGKPCSDCPRFADLSKKKRRKLLAKFKP